MTDNNNQLKVKTLANTKKKEKELQEVANKIVENYLTKPGDTKKIDLDLVFNQFIKKLVPEFETIHADQVSINSIKGSLGIYVCTIEFSILEGSLKRHYSCTFDTDFPIMFRARRSETI